MDMSQISLNDLSLFSLFLFASRSIFSTTKHSKCVVRCALFHRHLKIVQTWTTGDLSFADGKRWDYFSILYL